MLWANTKNNALYKIASLKNYTKTNFPNTNLEIIYKNNSKLEISKIDLQKNTEENEFILPLESIKGISLEKNYNLLSKLGDSKNIIYQIEYTLKNQNKDTLKLFCQEKIIYSPNKMI